MLKLLASTKLWMNLRLLILKSHKKSVDGFLYTINGADIKVWGEGKPHKVTVLNETGTPLSPDKKPYKRSGAIWVKAHRNGVDRNDHPDHFGGYLFLDKFVGVADLQAKIHRAN